MSSLNLYDVFLSHHSADKAAVEMLAQKLRQAGLSPFLDRWHLIPGEPWQEGLEQALEASRTCAVFLGANGIGPWENEEMRVALAERVRNPAFRVIPVLLPGVQPPLTSKLPRFLRRLTWVDFQSGLEDADAFYRFTCGIKGVAPGAVTGTAANPAPLTAPLVGEDPNPPNRQVLLQQLVDLLAPLMNRVDERHAWLQLALDERVCRRITFEGPTTTFILNMVTELQHYGEVVPGKPALVALLEVLREQVGIDKQRAIDELRAKLGDL